MIKLNNVLVDYGDIAFNFDDYTFEENKITFITGRNGSGKTTLLKAIANLLDYSGAISGSGSYLSQEPVIFNRSVKDNINYPLIIRGFDLSAYESKIDDLANKLSIRRLFEKNASKLSGGEKIKVALIRGMIFSPKVLLLDEPTTHLDIESIDELVKVLKELKKTMTLIIVSHNKSFIQELKDEEYYLELKNV